MNQMPSKETSSQILGIKLHDFIKTFLNHHDILLKYSIYETVEDTIIKYDIFDWNMMWDKCKEDKVNLLNAKSCFDTMTYLTDCFKYHKKKLIPLTIYKTEEEVLDNYEANDYLSLFSLANDKGIVTSVGKVIELSKYFKTKDEEEENEFSLYGGYRKFDTFIDIFQKYKLNDLKRFHDKGIVFDMTRYILYMRKKYGENNVYIDLESKNKAFYINIQNKAVKLRIDADSYNDQKKKEIDLMIYYSTYRINKIINEPSYFDDMKDIIDYIVNDLQYAYTKDLNKLITLTAKKFNVKLRGNPNNIPIYKFDATNGHFICMFEDRKDCLEKEGMSRAMLSKLLSQTTFSWHKRVYIEINSSIAEEEELNMERMLTRFNIEKIRKEQSKC